MGLENPLHIALLLMVLLLVFGAKRLPEMGRGLGDGLRSFKDAVSGQTPADTIAPPTHQDAIAPEAPVVSQPVSAEPASAEPAAVERQTVA